MEKEHAEFEKTLALEIMHELKQSARRWFIAFLVMIAVEILTIIGFLWYASLPVDTVNSTEIEQETDGDANTIIGIGGDYGN